MANEVPVLVVSCDRYADLWTPFFTLFWRHWPDCPYPVYLGTNQRTFDDARVTTIQIGADVGWAAGVTKMLDAVDSTHVILLLEDFFLLEPVDTGRVQRLVQRAIAGGAGCLRLYSILPPPRKRPDSDEIGWFAPGDDYAVTAQASLWRTSTLRELLNPGFNAWEFELLGNKLRDYMPDEFWGLYQPAIVYDQVVEKGKWRPEGLQICRDAGIVPDLNVRGVFTEDELQVHHRAAEPGSKRADAVRSVLARFRDQGRAAGIRAAGAELLRDPRSTRLWAVLAAGLLGSSATQWLVRRQLGWKVAKLNRRVAERPAGSDVRN